jgi:hypothetical protein
MDTARPPEFWYALIEHFETSGMTQPEFASLHGLPIGAFQSWLYRIRKERKKQKSSAPMRFMEVSAQTALTTPPPTSPTAVDAVNLERDQATQTSALVLQLRDGIALHFDSLPPAHYLAEFVSTLQGGRPC